MANCKHPEQAELSAIKPLFFFLWSYDCLYSIQWPVLVWPSQRIPICFKSRYMVLGVTFIVLAIFATVMVSSSHIIALIFLWRSFNELFIGKFGLTFGLTFSMSVTIDYLNILCHSYIPLVKLAIYLKRLSPVWSPEGYVLPIVCQGKRVRRMRVPLGHFSKCFNASSMGA